MIDLLITLLFAWTFMGFWRWMVTLPPDFKHQWKEVLYVALHGPIIWLMFVCMHVSDRLHEWFEK